MKHNRIPRKWHKIIGKLLVDTNMDRAGDIIYIYHTDSKYLTVNTRTGKHAYMFLSHIRNAEIFEVLAIN